MKHRLRILITATVLTSASLQGMQLFKRISFAARHGCHMPDLKTVARKKTVVSHTVSFCQSKNRPKRELPRMVECAMLLPVYMASSWKTAAWTWMIVLGETNNPRLTLIAIAGTTGIRATAKLVKEYIFDSAHDN